MKLTYVIMAAVLLAGVAFAQAPACDSTVNTYATWYCNAINVAVYNAWAPWIPLATAAILFSFFVGALIIMIGIAMRSERVKNFGVGELYEAVATTIIVIAFMFLAGVVIGLIPSGYVGNINPYNASLNYINNAILSSQKLFGGLFNVYSVDSYYASTSLSITTVGNTNINLFGYLADALEFFVLFPIQTLAQAISGALLTLHIEFYLLLFGMEASIPVFLIPGVIMRSIFPTRPIGGIFIGIAVGLFVVMPMLFSVAYYFTNQGLLQQLNTQTAQLNTYGSGTGAQTNGAAPNAPLVQTVQSINGTISSFWIAVLFFPALILAITIATIMTIADFIGGLAQRSGKLMFGV